MNRPFKIYVEDKETLNKVLMKMEKEGIKWWFSNDSPCMHRVDVPVALYVDEDNLLSHSGTLAFPYFKSHPNNEVTPEEYLKESKEMTKSDLKDWMIVKTRIGNNYMVDNTHDIIVSTNGWLSLNNYNNDLLCTDDDFDIVAVYEVTRPFAVRYFMQGVLERFEYLQPVWESEENPTEMTVAEIEKQLGIKNLKIIKEK